MSVNWNNIFRDQAHGMDAVSAFYKEEQRIRKQREEEYRRCAEEQKKEERARMQREEEYRRRVEEQEKEQCVRKQREEEYRRRVEEP